MKVNYHYPYVTNDGKQKYYITTKSEKKMYFGAVGSGHNLAPDDLTERHMRRPKPQLAALERYATNSAKAGAVGRRPRPANLLQELEKERAQRPTALTATADGVVGWAPRYGAYGARRHTST